MVKLLATIEDITNLTGFDANINSASINPFIFMAQNSEIKRVLGADLYDKIYTDFSANALTGDYLTIYNDYVKIILCYFSASFYLQLGIPKVSQNGAYLVTPEKTEQLYSEKTARMSEKYEKLAVGLELDLITFLNTLTIPEYESPDQTSAKSNFNWIKV